jgi:transcriptional regulator with XRE-family HTH domain
MSASPAALNGGLDGVDLDQQPAPSEPAKQAASSPHPFFGQDFQPLADEQIEDLIKAKGIGQKIRKLRLKRSMGLVELGQKTGMSASFLSQLETGRVVPTLRNLSRVAMVFAKELGYFFEEKTPNPLRISRRAERVRLPIGEKSAPHLISESMSALIPDRSLVPCIADFLPNSTTSRFEPHIFRGEEFVYVVEGSISLFADDHRHVLEAGDIAWIDGSTRRSYRCSDSKPARALIITRPS